jgi:hypothetical protein
VLEKPWTNGTTGDLLTRMIQDADLAGNFYARRRRGDPAQRMRPDWVSIILGSRDETRGTPGWELDAESLGYAYWPGGPNSAAEPICCCRRRSRTSRRSPTRGAVPRHVVADAGDPRDHGRRRRDRHKLKFFENGATPNLVVVKTSS